MAQKAPQPKTREFQKKKQELVKLDSKLICMPINQKTYNQIIEDKELFRGYNVVD